MAIEHLERLDGQVVGILEAIGVGEDLAVRELLGRLPLARGGGCQPGEDALGIGVGAARQEPEAVELGCEVVEPQAGVRPLPRGCARMAAALVVSTPAGHARTLSRAAP